MSCHVRMFARSFETEAMRAELPASIVRQGIEDGRFVVVDGVVRVAPRCESERMADRGCTNGENDV